MSGWLGQVPLKVSGRSLGSLNLQAQRAERSVPFLGQSRKRMGEISCCNAPNGMSYCFDNGTGECINTWNSSNPTPGAPDCVKNVDGFWVHPTCGGAAPVAPGATSGATEPPPSGAKPPGLACPLGNDRWTLVNYVTGALIASDIDRGQFGDYAGDITDLPADSACQDPRCSPYCGAAKPPPAPPPSQPTIKPVNIQPPAGGATPVPAAGVPVLPTRQTFSSPTQPTGAYPGQPFPTMGPSAPPPAVPIPTAPPPMPQPAPAMQPKLVSAPSCPLGPVPLKQWVDDCVGRKFY